MKEEFRKYMYDKEVTPPENVWTNIEQALDSKGKSRKFPLFWLLLAIVGMVGLIGGGAYYYINEKPVDNLKQSEYSKVPNSATKDNSFSDQQVKKIESENSITTEKIVESQSIPRSEEATHPKNIKSQKPITNKSYTNAPNLSSKKINKNDDFTPLASAKNSEETSFSTKSIKEKEEISIPTAEISTETLSKTQENTENPIAMNSETDQVESIQDLQHDSIKIAINSLKDNITPIDSSNLEDKTEEIGIDTSKEKNKKENSWEFSSFIAPSYTRSAGEGDIWLIDLYDYSGRYQDSENFGLHIQYNINKKWSVRSGIEINNMRQQAQDVAVTSQNITQSTDSDISVYENLSILNSSNFGNNDINFYQIKQANITQHIQYLSIPIEFGYSLYDSRILQLNAYLGTSTHLLRKNSITLSNDEFKIVYGEAKNLNKLVFGTQAGFQTRFKIGPRFGLIIEPKVLYFFDTFKNNNEVKPYTINLNAGFLFGF